MRRLPALLQDAPGTTGPMLRAPRARGRRRHGAHELRSIDRVLRRSDQKKPLNHFLPGSAVLSFGTAGCNLACSFCQNWDISKSREVARLSAHAAPDTIARAAERLGWPVSLTPTTTRSSSWKMRSTPQTPAAREA